jgi:hypothetical protein
MCIQCLGHFSPLIFLIINGAEHLFICLLGFFFEEMFIKLWWLLWLYCFSFVVSILYVYLHIQPSWNIWLQIFSLMGYHFTVLVVCCCSYFWYHASESLYQVQGKFSSKNFMVLSLVSMSLIQSLNMKCGRVRDHYLHVDIQLW